MAEGEIKIGNMDAGLGETEKELIDTRWALLHMLRDIDRERRESVDAFTAMLHILKDLDRTRKELEVAKSKVEEYSRTLEQKIEERTKELREAQEKLIRSEKLAALGKLAGIVAHELRNPLGVVRNSVYFLRMRLGKTSIDDKVKKHLTILEEEVDISNKIITDILTFGRIRPPQLSKVDIAEIISESLRRIGTVPDTIKITTKLGSNLPQILADKVQLGQVFYNIILNGIQAMPEGGDLIITEIKRGEFVETSIVDTGEGISRENLDKIFEPLFSTKIKGTGLGLSFCKSIIEMHKGFIEVGNRPEGGAKFVIKLPINRGE